MPKGTIGVTTNNIFPVIKKFLYSDHEIFLRELVSNAVDATQKLKTLQGAGEFKGFGEPIYWASNESSGAGAYAKIRIDLFEYAYNTEYTLQQSPVKSLNLFPLGDNNPVAFFNFDEPLPAGTYIVRYTLTNPEDYISVGGEEKHPYFVLPKMDSNPDENKFEYSSEDQVFNFTVLGEVINGEFFVDNPTEVSAPITEGHLYVSSAEGHAGDEVTFDVMITENMQDISIQRHILMRNNGRKRTDWITSPNGTEYSSGKSFVKCSTRNYSIMRKHIIIFFQSFICFLCLMLGMAALDAGFR